MRPQSAVPPDDAIAAREAAILGQPARILPLDPADLSDEARALALELRQAGFMPPVGAATSDYFPTVFRHTALFEKHSHLAIALMTEGALSARDRELAILRTAWLCRAPFEWGEHVSIGKHHAGLTSEEVGRVTEGSAAPAWGEPDRAILRAVEELHDDACISDATWAALATRLDERQLMELPVLVGQYHGVAFFMNSVRIPLGPTNPGLSAR